MRLVSGQELLLPAPDELGRLDGTAQQRDESAARRQYGAASRPWPAHGVGRGGGIERERRR
jgi:hypothetical protein